MLQKNKFDQILSDGVFRAKYLNKRFLSHNSNLEKMTAEFTTRRSRCTTARQAPQEGA